MKREEIVAIARTYLGTPFKHQGRIKGRGVDCIGLVIGIAKEIGIVDQDFEFTGYRRHPHGTPLLDLLSGYLVEKDPGSSPQPGDILVIRYRVPQHVAIVSRREGETLWMLHTQERVVEHRVDTRWSDRIVSIFEFPVETE